MTIHIGAHTGHVCTFTVGSFHTPGTFYVVRYHTRTRATRCTCPDGFFRHTFGGRCKHGKLIAGFVRRIGVRQLPKERTAITV